MTDLPETEGLGLVKLLDLLKPIPEPEPISMWPATTAWIWVGIAAVAVLMWIGWYGYRRWRTNAYRRAALTELDKANDDPAVIAAILRRTALVAFPREQVAGTVGRDWLDFLDRTYPDKGFSSEFGQVLMRAPYRNEPQSPDLTRLARSWVKRHKPEARS